MRALLKCLGFAVLMVVSTAVGAVLSGNALEGWAG
jgi:hypothetical protein